MLIKELSNKTNIKPRDLVKKTPTGLLCYITDCLNRNIPFGDLLERLENLEIQPTALLQTINNTNVIETVFNHYKELQSVEAVYELC